MNRIRALEERKALLLTRCALQRDTLDLQVGIQIGRAENLDQGLVAVGRWTRSPASIGIALLTGLLFWRARSVTGVATGLGLLGTLIQVRRIAGTLLRQAD